MAYAALGWLQGSIVLLVVSLLSTIGLHFLSRLSANLDMGDYFSVGREAYGVPGEIITMISLILFIFGALCFYIDISTNLVCAFLTHFFSLSKYAEPFTGYSFSPLRLVTLFAISLVIFPLAAQRDMRSLAKASLAGMVCMILILLLVIFDFFYDSETRAKATTVAFGGLSFKIFFEHFSSILFTFVNHFTMLPSVVSLINPTPERRLSMTLISAAVVLVFNWAIGIFGYFHFGSQIAENATSDVLQAATTLTFVYKCSSLVMGIVLILTFPLLLDPCRGTIERTIEIAMGKNKKKESSKVNAMSPNSLGITAVLITAAALIALFFIAQIGSITNFFCGLTGPMLLFALPSMFFLRLSDNYSVSSAEKIASYILTIFGLFVAIVGTYYNGAALFGHSK